MKSVLLEKAIKGNKRALKKLISKESEHIYKLAFLHTKYEEDATTILNNTTAYIYESIHRLSRYKDFHLYVLKVTIKHINEFLEEYGIVDNPHYNYIMEDGKINLYYAMDLLENRLKNTIILRYFYNMSYKEIGDILDLNESTVKLYIRKSLKLMALDLEENFQNEK